MNLTLSRWHFCHDIWPKMLHHYGLSEIDVDLILIHDRGAILGEYNDDEFPTVIVNFRGHDSKEEIIKTMLHELQHALQPVDWKTGGNRHEAEAERIAQEDYAMFM